MSRIAPEELAKTIADEKYLHEGSVTFCIIELVCGFVVTGQTVCTVSESFDKDKGCKLAYKDALSKLSLMERYYQRKIQHERRGNER